MFVVDDTTATIFQRADGRMQLYTTRETERVMTINLIGAVLCVLSFAAVELSAQSQDERQIRAAEDAMGKAIADGDVVAYDKLAADDFQFITGAGAILKKSDRLALLKKGPTPGFTTVPDSIRTFGNVAIVTGRQGLGGAVRYTRVWVRQNNEWRAVVTQATAIGKPQP